MGGRMDEKEERKGTRPYLNHLWPLHQGKHGGGNDGAEGGFGDVIQEGREARQDDRDHQPDHHIVQRGAHALWREIGGWVGGWVEGGGGRRQIRTTSAATAVRPKLPVAGNMEKGQETRLAMPRAMASWLTSISYLYWRAGRWVG